MEYVNLVVKTFGDLVTDPVFKYFFWASTAIAIVCWILTVITDNYSQANDLFLSQNQTKLETSLLIRLFFIGRSIVVDSPARLRTRLPVRSQFVRQEHFASSHHHDRAAVDLGRSFDLQLLAQGRLQHVHRRLPLDSRSSHVQLPGACRFMASLQLFLHRSPPELSSPRTRPAHVEVTPI